MRDLDALKNAAGASDETTHAQLKAVGQTLADVVDRLGRIEREGQHGSASGAVFSIGAPAEPAPAPKPGGEAGSAPGERAFERRADFIAAARRAAQTAAPQAAPSPPAGAAPVPAVERRPSAHGTGLVTFTRPAVARAPARRR